MQHRQQRQVAGQGQPMQARIQRMPGQSDGWACAGGSGAPRTYPNFLTRRWCRACGRPRPSRPQIVDVEPRGTGTVGGGGPQGRDGMRPMLSWGRQRPSSAEPGAIAVQRGQPRAVVEAEPLPSSTSRLPVWPHAQAAPPQQQSRQQQSQQQQQQQHQRLPPRVDRATAQPSQQPQYYDIQSSGGEGHEDADERNEHWQQGGPGKKQRRKLRKQRQRAGGGGTGRGAGAAAASADGQPAAGVADGPPQQLDGGTTREADQAPWRQTRQPNATDVPVPPFVAPTLTRRAIATKSELLRVRLTDCRARGEDEQARQLEKEVAEADRDTRLAGGASESKLRLSALDQARKVERKRGAVTRARKELSEAIERRDKAVSEVRSAEAKVELLEEELKGGLERQAYLAAQQAAETRPRTEGEEVRKVLQALHAVGPALPQELQLQLSVFDRVVETFYPCEQQVQDLVEQTGLGVDSDTDVSDGTDTEADGEPEVTGAMLVERRTARKEHKRLRNERGAELLASISSGRPTVQEIAAKYSGDIATAAARAKKAEDQLRAGRAAARARLRQKRAEQQQQQQQHDDDEEVPCLPPTKWRKGDNDGDSDATIDETPVISNPSPTTRASSSANLASVATVATVSTAAAGEEQQQQEPQQQGTELRRKQPSRPAEGQARADHPAAAAATAAPAQAGTTPATLPTIIADCSVRAVEHAAKAAASSTEGRRPLAGSTPQRGLVELMAARWGRGRPASHDAGTRRATGGSACGDGAKDRSKSPRRVQHATAAMED